MEAYKTKHAEVLEEVHTLRRENYDMRTVVSDPRTQQHMIEVAKTSEVFTQSPRDEPSDSLSPNRTTASEAERDFEKMKEEYDKKLNDLNESHQKDIQETVRGWTGIVFKTGNHCTRESRENCSKKPG